MLIELIVHEGNERYSLCDCVEITVKPNSRYSDTFEVVDLLQEAIYEALESAEIEVTDE